jgi:hypothetical protein
MASACSSSIERYTLLRKGDTIELVAHRFVEALANAIGGGILRQVCHAEMPRGRGHELSVSWQAMAETSNGNGKRGGHRSLPPQHVPGLSGTWRDLDRIIRIFRPQPACPARFSARCGPRTDARLSREPSPGVFQPGDVLRATGRLTCLVLEGDQISFI